MSAYSVVYESTHYSAVLIHGPDGGFCVSPKHHTGGVKLLYNYTYWLKQINAAVDETQGDRLCREFLACCSEPY